MRLDILERKEEILQWISEELTLGEISKRLRCKRDTLSSYLKKLDIEYKGQQSRKGQQKGPNKYKDSSYYTYKGAPYIHSAKLREKLVRDGLKENKCEKCGNVEWLGKRLPLELHHKNGDHFDNELDNLEILCPNCHAVEAPNAGAAKGSYVKPKKQKLSPEELALKEEKRKLKAREASKRAREKAKLIEQNPEKVDSFGRVNLSILTEAEWLARKDLIMSSGVDLTKYGWKEKVQRKTGLTVRQLALTIQHFSKDFSGKIYIRN
jgi:hypothetical protein